MTVEVATFACGRVNLIGEHTDYNGGLVMPLRLGGHRVQVLARERPDGVLSIRSEAMGEAARVEPGAALASIEPRWARLGAAVVDAIRERGIEVPGMDVLVVSTLPVGAGLGSSAAFAVALARAALQWTASGALLRDVRLAQVCRTAEERATGVKCGLMDQITACRGITTGALLLDCGTLVSENVPLDRCGVAIVVADSGVRHELATTEYNRRREECEEALGLLRAALGPCDLQDLSALTPDDLPRIADTLPDRLARRVRHVVTENARVRDAARALRRSDPETFGRALDASHESLRDDYEVSCAELDRLVALARAVPGVLGSRMTGGGFGGSTVTAVRADAVERVVAELPAASRPWVGWPLGGGGCDDGP